MSKKQLFIKWETNDGLTMISKYILPESISKDLDGKQGENLNHAVSLISLGFNFFPDEVPSSFVRRLKSSYRNGWRPVNCTCNFSTNGKKKERRIQL